MGNSGLRWPLTVLDMDLLSLIGGVEKSFAPVMVHEVRRGAFMINVYETAIASARRVDATINAHMRGWAVLQGNNFTSLIALAYESGGRVSAYVAWYGIDHALSMELIARHMNDRAGTEPVLVDALARAYQHGAGAQGQLAAICTSGFAGTLH